MPATAITSAIVSTIVNAIAGTPSTVETPAPQPAAVQTFAARYPATARAGKLQSALINIAVIDGRSFPLSPVLQVRNAQNLIVMSGSVLPDVMVRYQLDASGDLARLWLLSAAEIAALPVTLPATTLTP